MGMCVMGICARDARADVAPRIRLRGSAHLNVHAARAAGKLALSGTVNDDAARPIPGVRILIGLTRTLDPRSSVGLSASAPEPCGGSTVAPVLDRADLLVLTTDEASRFCVRLGLATDRYVAHIEAHTSGLVDGTKLDLPLDLALAPVTLRFDPEPWVLSLDDETTSFEVIASTEDEGITAPAAGLALTISNEADAPLGSATTNASGRAKFLIDSARLGPPGDGELRVTFAGTAGAGSARRAVRVERRTHVDVAAPDASSQRLPPGCPDDGITLRLVATPRCARHGCLQSPSGLIEARVEDRIVGAAPVEHSEARLVITFAATSADAFPRSSAGEVPVTFRYVPDAPWFQPTGELVLEQPVRGPSPWKKVPLALAATAVVAWLALTRFPMRSRGQRRTARPLPSGHVVEQVELVRAASPSHGWKGRVADAHDGLALAQAHVAIVRAGFERLDVVTETTSDAGGAFVLPPIDRRPGDELVVDSPLHTGIRSPLPQPGELAVALVLRKRALLDRLVAWARRQGTPYVTALEPTPGHVQRAAGSSVAVGHWANAVERAAYGGAVVDERAEAEVDRLAPSRDP
jgi:hypothetical protein